MQWIHISTLINLTDHTFLDFHNHQSRHLSDAEVTEVVSVHLGQEKAKQYFTIGMHPWWTDTLPDEAQKAELLRLLSLQDCLAMGEIGLDHLKGPALPTQIAILRELLQIARQAGKPVVIHCVRAYSQLLQLKKEFPDIQKWCIHGYGRNAQLARQLTDQGFYLSLMPGMPDVKYRLLLESIPEDRLFLETDSMPGTNIKEIYARTAQIRGIELAHLCRRINQNARDFFGL